MADGRWFPVYYEDLAENYARVWDEPRLLWTWARLFAVHDRSWPLPGELPRGLTKAALGELAAMELITLLPKHRFTVRGLDARRNAQRSAASNAARTRHGNAPSNAERNAYQTKPNQTKPEIPTGAKSSVPREGNGLSPATHPEPKKQPSVERRLVELQAALDETNDPDLRTGIEETIKRMGGTVH